MQKSYLIAVPLLFLHQNAQAANFPDCSVLATVDWQSALISNDAAERALGVPLVDFEDADFQRLKDVIAQCADEAPGDRFGQYAKSYLSISLFPRIDEAQASMPRVREQYQAELYVSEASADLEWYLDLVTTVGEDGNRGTLTPDQRQVVLDYIGEIETRRAQSAIWAANTSGLIQLAEQVLEKADEAVEYNAAAAAQKEKAVATLKAEEEKHRAGLELNQSNTSGIPHSADLPIEAATLQQLFLIYLTGKLCSSHNASYTVEEVSLIEAEIKQFVKSTPLDKPYRDKLWSASTQAMEMYQHKFGTGDCAASRSQAIQMFPKIFQDPDKLAEENPF